MRKILGVWLGLEILTAWLVCHWMSLGGLLLSWLLAAVVGSLLLRGLGAHLRQMRQGTQGIALTGPIARVLAAFLFIIPGTLSDLFALLLLIPATQTQLSRRFAGSTAGWAGSTAGWAGSAKGWAGTSAGWNASSGPAGRVIEGEYAEEIDKNRQIGPGQ